MTEEQIVAAKKEIDGMTQYSMALMYRFSPSGHPYFSDTIVSDYFMARFSVLGGMTQEISESLGWGN